VLNHSYTFSTQSIVILETDKLEATKPSAQTDDDQVGSSPIRKIIYIEDNIMSLKLMRSIVSQIPNTSLTVAHNARLGLALVYQKKPDLILLDINLPGMSGMEALGLLRHMGNTRHIPVFALTANAEPEARERGLKAGFDAYLTKPVMVKGLIQKINAIFDTLD